MQFTALKRSELLLYILGCTELGLLIRQSDASIPVFDTTTIHAKMAAQLAAEDHSRW